MLHAFKYCNQQVPSQPRRELSTMRRAGQTSGLLLALVAVLHTMVYGFLPAGLAPSSTLIQSSRYRSATSVPRPSSLGGTVVRMSDKVEGTQAQGGAAAAAPAAAPAVADRTQQFSRPPRGPRPDRNRNFNQKDQDADKPLMNDALVRSGPSEVRVVISKGEEGDEMVGVMAAKDALAKARELEMDLIMISENANPPVCKIIDYGKYKYNLEKKKKEQKKKAKTTEVKEVKMSYKIEAHDYGVRMKQMIKFLDDGDRVKVMVQFRGREQQHIDLGVELLQKLGVDLKDIASMESDIKREGGRLMAMFKPKK